MTPNGSAPTYLPSQVSQDYIMMTFRSPGQPLGGVLPLDDGEAVREGGAGSGTNPASCVNMALHHVLICIL